VKPLAPPFLQISLTISSTPPILPAEVCHFEFTNSIGVVREAEKAQAAMEQRV
jgi:hypothetical protein